MGALATANALLVAMGPSELTGSAEQSQASLSIILFLQSREMRKTRIINPLVTGKGSNARDLLEIPEPKWHQIQVQWVELGVGDREKLRNPSTVSPATWGKY